MAKNVVYKVLDPRTPGGAVREFASKAEADAYLGQLQAQLDENRISVGKDRRQKMEGERVSRTNLTRNLIKLAADGKLVDAMSLIYDLDTPEGKDAYKQVVGLVLNTLNETAAADDVMANFFAATSGKQSFTKEDLLGRVAFDEAKAANVASRILDRAELEGQGVPSSELSEQRYDKDAQKVQEMRDSRFYKPTMDREITAVRNKDGSLYKDAATAEREKDPEVRAKIEQARAAGVKQGVPYARELDPVLPKDVKNEPFASKTRREQAAVEKGLRLDESEIMNNPEQFQNMMQQLLTRMPNLDAVLTEADRKTGDQGTEAMRDELVPTSSVSDFDPQLKFLQDMQRVFPDFAEPGKAADYMNRVAIFGGRAVVEAQDGVLIDLWTGEPFQAPPEPMAPMPVISDVQMGKPGMAPMPKISDVQQGAPGMAPMPTINDVQTGKPGMAPMPTISDVQTGKPSEAGKESAIAKLQQMMQGLQGAMEGSALSQKAAQAEAGGPVKATDVVDLA